MMKMMTMTVMTMKSGGSGGDDDDDDEDNENGDYLDSSRPRDTYTHQCTRPALVCKMAYCLFGAKPLSDWMLDSYEQISVKFESKRNNFHSRKQIWIWPLQNGGHFVLASMCQQERLILNIINMK